MHFSVGCRLRYLLSGPGTIIFNVHAIHLGNQKVLSEQFLAPQGALCDDWTDPATQNRFMRVNYGQNGEGMLEISYNAEIETNAVQSSADAIGEISAAQLPLNVVPFLYPSRYCENDRLGRLAFDEFGGFQPGFSRVTGICNYIYNNISYERGSSGEHTSAFDTVTERAGVCRDFAHLGIAFCRALNIPARFVSGYAYGLQPPDFHACFEAYLGDSNKGAWYLFDATRLAPQTGYVRIGSGRDAADVSFATMFGNVQFQSMNITMNSSDGPPQYTTSAVAIA